MRWRWPGAADSAGRGPPPGQPAGAARPGGRRAQGSAAPSPAADDGVFSAAGGRVGPARRCTQARTQAGARAGGGSRIAGGLGPAVTSGAAAIARRSNPLVGQTLEVGGVVAGRLVCDFGLG